MNLDCIILNTRGQRPHTFKTPAPQGPARPVIKQAEDAARAWARSNDLRVVSDIVSHGMYRAWVEPIPAGRLRTMRQMESTNQRINTQQHAHA